MKKLLVSMGCLVLLGGCATINSPSLHQSGKQEFVTAPKGGYQYLIYLPKDYNPSQSKRWPVLIFLHGSGEQGDDINKVKIHGPPQVIESGKDLQFITISIQCPQNTLYETTHLDATLKNALKGLQYDNAKIYLTGLSLGGMATWGWAIDRPHLFAAIAPIAGMANPIDATKILNLPIWAFHGAKDDVVPKEGDQYIIDSINELGGKNAKITIYPEANHNSWTQTYDNPEFYAWLLTNTNPTPSFK